MSLEPRSLRAIAEESAFAAADVAFLAGVDEATVSRLWEVADWLDRVKGSTLQALIAVIPGLGSYVCNHSLSARRAQLLEDLDDLGITVDQAKFEHVVTSRGVPEPHLASALEAIAHVLRGDHPRAAAHLARFWGLVQDQALGYVYASPGSGGLLVDRTSLVEASAAMADRLSSVSRSFHATLAHANLAHQVARATGEAERSVSDAPTTRQAALTYRSAVMGSIIETDDADLADRYSRAVQTEPVLELVETWAFPTYTRDCRPTSDLLVPSSLVLRNTAAEILRELETYNNAYFHYLMTTGIPAVLAHDPTFGLRGSDLRRAVEARLSDRPSRRTSDRVLHNLEEYTP